VAPHAAVGLEIERMFYVYVLRSESDSGFYIGFSTNLRARLRQHQGGESFATSHRGPWKLIYYEAYLNERTPKAERNS
jgi:putative endonuclease